MKVFSDRPHKGGKPTELKEWVIERIKKRVRTNSNIRRRKKVTWGIYYSYVNLALEKKIHKNYR